MSINVRDEFLSLFTEEELREIRNYKRNCIVVKDNHKGDYKAEMCSEDFNTSR